MLRALPVLWFLLAALGPIGQLMAVAASGQTPAQALAYAGPSAVMGTVSAIGMALVYMMIGQTRPSVPVTIIGYSHLFMAVAARIAGGLAEVARSNLINGNSSGSTLAMTFSAASIAGFLSGVVFILALIVALNTRHVRPEDIF